jgi:hypothetical protein
MLLFAVFCGCASQRTEKNGCPSGKTWYQPGKTAEQIMQDLAFCQNRAALYGQSSFMRGEQKVSWAILDAMAESARQDKIIRTGMIAKGYTMVDKNSPLLSNTEAAQPISSLPTRQDENLKRLQQDVYYAGAEAWYWRQGLARIKAGKEWKPITGWDSNGNAITGPVRQPTDADAERVQSNISKCLQTQQEKIGELLALMLDTCSDADKSAARDLIGHWQSVAFKLKTPEEGLEKVELEFLPDNRCVATTTVKGRSYLIKGQYVVKGRALILADPNTAPEPQAYSLIGDHLVVTFNDGEAIFQRAEKKSP